MKAHEKTDILDAIEHWERLAKEQDDAAEEDRGGAQAHKHRAELYRRTAESLRLELVDGVPRCVCCFKPLGPRGEHR